MKTDDFDFVLPKESIAQRPAEPRDASRLMRVSRETGCIEDHVFSELPNLLRPGDVLVLNETKVLPARLIGEKAGSGGKVEVLLLNRRSLDTWETLVRPGKRLKTGARVTFGQGKLTGEVIGHSDGGGRVVRFEWAGSFEDVLDQLGQMPLPPYISEPLDHPDRYQTVYAREQGSAAAPTAGLHFTQRLLAALAERGIRLARITLHVGLGTFRPVSVDRIEEHHMHAEYYRVPEEAAEAVCRARETGKRVVAVGTTVTRTLETVSDSEGRIKPGDGWTDIFIYPGYRFKCVDALITNFHLPRSTLLMLVSAFAGRDRMMRAYERAVSSGYRFYSFGDAMLIE